MRVFRCDGLVIKTNKTKLTFALDKRGFHITINSGERMLQFTLNNVGHNHPKYASMVDYDMRVKHLTINPVSVLFYGKPAYI